MKNITYINPPETCDICHSQVGDVMYDAKTVYGPWANMCENCFNTIGVGLGTGLGQRYVRRNVNGVDKFIKQEG